MDWTGLKCLELASIENGCLIILSNGRTPQQLWSMSACSRIQSCISKQLLLEAPGTH